MKHPSNVIPSPSLAAQGHGTADPSANVTETPSSFLVPYWLQDSNLAAAIIDDPGCNATTLVQAEMRDNGTSVESDVPQNQCDQHRQEEPQPSLEAAIKEEHKKANGQDAVPPLPQNEQATARNEKAKIQNEPEQSEWKQAASKQKAVSFQNAGNIESLAKSEQAARDAKQKADFATEYREMSDLQKIFFASNLPRWIADMRSWQQKRSKKLMARKTLDSYMDPVIHLASGIGILAQCNTVGFVFCKGIKVDLAHDLEGLIDEATKLAESNPKTTEPMMALLCRPLLRMKQYRDDLKKRSSLKETSPQSVAVDFHAMREVPTARPANQTIPQRRTYSALQGDLHEIRHLPASSFGGLSTESTGIDDDAAKWSEVLMSRKQHKLRKRVTRKRPHASRREGRYSLVEDLEYVSEAQLKKQRERADNESDEEPEERAENSAAKPVGHEAVIDLVSSDEETGAGYYFGAPSQPKDTDSIGTSASVEIVKPSPRTPGCLSSQIHDTSESVVIALEVPGYQLQDIKLFADYVDNDDDGRNLILSIKGSPSKASNSAPFRKEYFLGQSSIQEDKVEMQSTGKGAVTITIPKVTADLSTTDFASIVAASHRLLLSTNGPQG